MPYTGYLPRCPILSFYISVTIFYVLCIRFAILMILRTAIMSYRRHPTIGKFGIKSLTSSWYQLILYPKLSHTIIETSLVILNFDKVSKPPPSLRVKWGAVDTVNQPAKRPLTRFCFYPQQSSHKRTTEKYFLSRLEFIPVALYCASSCRILIIAQDKCLVMNKVDACRFYEQEMISKYWVQIRNSKLRKLYLYLNTYYIVQR